MSWERYRQWCVQYNTNDVSYDEWVAGEAVNNRAKQRQIMVTDIVAGDVAKVGEPLRAFQEVIASGDEDLRVFLVSIARSRSRRINTMLEYLDRVEDRLMRNVDVDLATMDQLLSTYRLLTAATKEMITLVNTAITSTEARKADFGGSTFNVSLDLGDKILGDSAANLLKDRDSRDRVRTAVGAFVKVLENVGVSNTVPNDRPATVDV